MPERDPRMNFAIRAVASNEGWDRCSTRECGLLLWTLFRYYAMRLSVTFGEEW